MTTLPSAAVPLQEAVKEAGAGRRSALAAADEAQQQARLAKAAWGSVIKSVEDALMRADALQRDLGALKPRIDGLTTDIGNEATGARKSASDASVFRASAERSASEAADAAKRASETQPEALKPRLDVHENRISKLETAWTSPNPLFEEHEKRISAFERTLPEPMKTPLDTHDQRLSILEGRTTPPPPPPLAEHLMPQVKDHERRIGRLEVEPIELVRRAMDEHEMRIVALETPQARIPTSERELSPEGRRRIQEALAKLNFNPGPNDGGFGKKTRDAIARFQDSLHVSRTKQLTADQIARLWKATETKPPTHGAPH